MDRRDEMDEQDALIRRKVLGLDTLPPGTGWRPEGSWERIRSELSPQPDSWYAPLRAWIYCGAAALVILLVPFAVMLSDIRAQQAQIGRLTAQLKRASAAGSQPVPLVAEKNAADKTGLPPLAPAAARVTAPQKMAPRKTSKGRRAIQAPVEAQGEKEPQPAVLPAEYPLAQQPGPVAAKPAGETAAPEKARAENAAARLLRVVNTGSRRKPSSVTLVFEGTDDDSTAQEALAAQTAPSTEAPRKRFLRVFQGSKGEEAPPQPAGPSGNILSVLTKNQ